MNTDIQEHQSKVLYIFKHAVFLLSAGFPLNARLLAEIKSMSMYLYHLSLSLETHFSQELY